jgi:hypothetical protein
LILRLVGRKGDLLTYLCDWLGGLCVRIAASRRRQGYDWDWRSK